MTPKQLPMQYLSIGIMLGLLLSMVIITFFPLPETTQTCGSCGAKAWYFQVAD